METKELFRKNILDSKQLKYQFSTRIMRDLGKYYKPDLNLEIGSYFICGDVGVGKTLFSINMVLNWYIDNEFNIEQKLDAISTKIRNNSFMDPDTGETWHDWEYRGKDPKADRKKYLFYNANKFIEDLKDYFNAPGNPQIYKDMKTVDWLIIDDFGQNKMSDWVLDIFYNILNSRYEDLLPTVINSNLNLSQITKTFDKRISSRITRMCGGNTNIIELKDK